MCPTKASDPAAQKQFEAAVAAHTVEMAATMVHPHALHAGLVEAVTAAVEQYMTKTPTEVETEQQQRRRGPTMTPETEAAGKEHQDAVVLARQHGGSREDWPLGTRGRVAETARRAKRLIRRARRAHFRKLSGAIVEAWKRRRGKRVHELVKELATGGRVRCNIDRLRRTRTVKW